MRAAGTGTGTWLRCAGWGSNPNHWGSLCAVGREENHHIKMGRGTADATAEVDRQACGLVMVKEEGWQKNKFEMFWRGTGAPAVGYTELQHAQH